MAQQYRLVHGFFCWWTGRLVKNEKWFAVYVAWENPACRMTMQGYDNDIG